MPFPIVQDSSPTSGSECSPCSPAKDKAPSNTPQFWKSLCWVYIEFTQFTPKLSRRLWSLKGSLALLSYCQYCHLPWNIFDICTTTYIQLHHVRPSQVSRWKQSILSSLPGERFRAYTLGAVAAKSIAAIPTSLSLECGWLAQRDFETLRNSKQEQTWLF